ncbi:MAG: hypothetical protein V4582_06080 [Pseudomonadota bacterium]
MKMTKSVSMLVSALVLVGLSAPAFAELCVQGRKTEVYWKGEWYKATITQGEATRCRVTYEGYGSEWDEWIGPERMKIKVLWKGEWYPARAVRREGANYLVHYDGYTDDDNEIVPVSRMQVR